jgi:hypothetical protein
MGIRLRWFFVESKRKSIAGVRQQPSPPPRLAAISILIRRCFHGEKLPAGFGRRPGWGEGSAPCDSGGPRDDQGRVAPGGRAWYPGPPGGRYKNVRLHGAGVQAIAERFDKPVYAGLDTAFIGILEERATWTEKCIACGKCVLHEYGGIRPVTWCVKDPGGGSTSPLWTKPGCSPVRGTRLLPTPARTAFASRIGWFADRRASLRPGSPPDHR